MRGRVHAIRTLKGLVADLRLIKNKFHKQQYLQLLVKISKKILLRAIILNNILISIWPNLIKSTVIEIPAYRYR
jgi:hypothetical protein